MSRSSASESEVNTRAGTDADILQSCRGEAEAVFEEYPFLSEHISLTQFEFYVADWKRKRGNIRYKKVPKQKSFGQRINSSGFESVDGNFAVGLARRVYEEGNNWEGTIRHEIAHGYLYEKHGETMGHGDEFKEVNRWIEGSWKVDENPGDYHYALSCPDGCFVNGYYRRSKKIQEPWYYHCTECGAMCVSHDYEDGVPEEGGYCLVESIDWVTETDYLLHETGEL